MIRVIARVKLDSLKWSVLAAGTLLATIQLTVYAARPGGAYRLPALLLSVLAAFVTVHWITRAAALLAAGAFVYGVSQHMMQKAAEAAGLGDEARQEAERRGGYNPADGGDHGNADPRSGRAPRYDTGWEGR